MKKHTKVISFEDMFMQNNFAQLNQLLDQSLQDPTLKDQYLDFYILKSNTLYELNDVENSRYYLQLAINHSSPDHILEKLYYKGRLNYLESNFEDAALIFNKIKIQTEPSKLKFKSLLALATTYITLSKASDQFLQDLHIVIAELRTFNNYYSRENELCYQITLALYFAYFKEEKLETILNHMYQALTLANQKQWDYYIFRIYYYLVLIYKKFEKTESMHTIIAILQCSIKLREQNYFAKFAENLIHDINSKDYEILQFDKNFLRIKYEAEWISLYDKPFIYKFIELTFKAEEFVNKETIAKTLWPQENYLPRIFDPRIFDIVKRTRNFLKEHKAFQLQLISNRLGYKLVTEDQSAVLL